MGHPFIRDWPSPGHAALGGVGPRSFTRIGDAGELHGVHLVHGFGVALANQLVLTCRGEQAVAEHEAMCRAALARDAVAAPKAVAYRRRRGYPLNDMQDANSPIEDDALAGALTADVLQELRADLERLRQEIDLQLETTKEGSQPVLLDQQAVGRLSRMDAMQHQQVAVASRRELTARKLRVQSALAAMGRQEYGDCRRCEEPIGYKRLKVRPEALFCLRCQAATESSR